MHGLKNRTQASTYLHVLKAQFGKVDWVHHRSDNRETRETRVIWLGALSSDTETPVNIRIVNIYLMILGWALYHRI